MASSRTAWALVLGSGVLIGLATLSPMPPGPVPDGAQVQPERPIHLADGLRNVALFAPLGMGLAALGWRALPALGLGLLLSAGIETGQHWLPGRHPGLGDVLTNALGTAAGHGLVRTARVWLRPGAGTATRLAVASAGLLGLAFAATGALFAPGPSRGPAFGHLPPRLAQLPPYPGRVRRAWVAGVEVRTGEIAPADAELLHRRLRKDRRIAVEAVAAVPRLDSRGLLLVSDAGPHEVLMLGAQGEDLQYRYLSRGRALGFDRATLRFPGLLADLSPGKSFRVEIEHRRGHICAGLGERSECRGYTPADGWRLLLGELPLLTARPDLAGALWLAACGIPLGFWSRTPRSGAAAVALAGAGLLAAPWVGPVLLPPAPALLGAAGGFAAGQGAARLVA